jgi:hypothetical protein
MTSDPDHIFMSCLRVFALKSSRYPAFGRRG